MKYDDHQSMEEIIHHKDPFSIDTLTEEEKTERANKIEMIEKYKWCLKVISSEISAEIRNILFPWALTTKSVDSLLESNRYCPLTFVLVIYYSELCEKYRDNITK